MAAAKLLDSKMREVRGNNRMAALDRVAVLAALNLAHELQQLRDDSEGRDRELARTLGDLHRKLDGLFDARRALNVRERRAPSHAPRRLNRTHRADERTAPSRLAALYFAHVLCCADSVRKHSPCPLMTTTGMQRKPGVQVRLVAGSPKASKHSHLNPGFKVVSQHRHGGGCFFSRADAPRRSRWRCRDDPSRVAGSDTARSRYPRRMSADRARTAPRTARHAAARFPPRERIAAAERLADAPARAAVRAASGYVAGYWAMDGEIALHAWQTAPARRLHLLPAGAARRRAPALRALASGRCAGHQPLRHSRARCRADCAARRPSRWRWSSLPLVGFDARGHRLGMGGGWYDRSFAFRQRRSRRRRGWSAPRSPLQQVDALRRRALGRRAGRGLHRIATTLSDRHRDEPRMSARTPLLADEVRTRRVLDRRPAARRHRALERRAQLPGAQLHARRMQVGDGVLFYHSSCDVPGIVGIADGRQRGLSGPDPVRSASPTTSTPRARARNRAGTLVDVAFERKLKRTIPLDEIKQHADALGEDFALIRRGNRLSVMPVTAAQWKFLLSLE